MPRWLLMAVGLAGVFLASGLSIGGFGFRQPQTPVTVFVTLNGQPADALIRVFHNEQFLGYEYTNVHTPGEARFALPGGAYTLQVEHGAGFTSLPQRIEINASGEPMEVSASLERLIEPNDFGYYAADLHAHTVASAKATFEIFGIPNHGTTPVDQAVGVQLAADLDVVFVSDHNTASSHEVFAATAVERGAPYVLSEEITTLMWGHYNAFSLNPGELVEFGFAKTPGQFFAEAREHGASIIQINHPYSIGFGYFFAEDSPQFNDSFDAVEVFNDHFDDGDLRTIQRLFAFWNEGRRFIATAVSDDHDWKIEGAEYGVPRTYVHMEGELTAEAFLIRLKAGRAFVTYGPMLMLSNADGAIPGDTVSSGDFIVNLTSVESLAGTRLELVHNGSVVESVALDGSETVLNFNVDLDSPSWVAAQLLSAPRRYLALTNPLWIAP